MILLSLYLGISSNSAGTIITKFGQKVDPLVRSTEDISPSTSTGDIFHLSLTQSRDFDKYSYLYFQKGLQVYGEAQT